MASMSEKRRLEIQKAAREGRIEFAPAEKVTVYAVLLHDFMEHIMGISGYLITDYSSIYDFSIGETDEQEIQTKIKERYGVRMRIGTKNSRYLCDILERLAVKISQLED